MKPAPLALLPASVIEDFHLHHNLQPIEAFQKHFEGAHFIRLLGHRLSFPIRTIATSQLYFHRFYLSKNHSFSEYPHIDLALTATLVGSKAEETYKRIRQILAAAFLIMHPEFKGTDVDVEIVEEHRRRVIMYEKEMLLAINFGFVVKHPFEIMLSLAKAYHIPKQMAEDAWIFLQDCYLTTAPVEYPSSFLALAALIYAERKDPESQREGFRSALPPLEQRWRWKQHDPVKDPAPALRPMINMAQNSRGTETIADASFKAEYQRPSYNIVEMFQQKDWLRVAAPMVRYSRLPFRLTVSHFGVDLAYTPMILADSFARSAQARNIEYQVCLAEGPVVAQFAAKNSQEFGDAVEMISPFVDGIDLNCGCPQRWAIQEGIGAAVLEKPVEMVIDMIHTAKAKSAGKPISVKMRLLEGENAAKRTIEWARSMEKAGVNWITVHGRTKSQRPHEPIDVALIKTIVESVNIPVVANGNVSTYENAVNLQSATKAKGIMAARGLLENPALFVQDHGGYNQNTTSWLAVSTYTRHALAYGTPTPIFLHHLQQMLGRILPPVEQRFVNAMTSSTVVIDYLKDVYPDDFVI